MVHLQPVRSKATKFIVGVLLGAAAGLVAGFSGCTLDYIVLVTWDVIALSILLMTWWDVHGKDGSHTRTLARREELSASLTDIILVLASVISLAAVVSLLATAEHSLTRVAFALISIVLSWAMVHGIYMIRYAVMYYDDVPKDGIDFGETTEPTFIDFAYIAFTVGMTYQVSDTTFTTTRFRRVALRHALLSFVFGTAIIATSINFVAGLGK